MLVSVLIANYNKKKYIKRCLNSLESQTYKEFEVIFFDDKSNDNSVSEVKKFLNKLKIKLIINKKKKFNITAYDQMNSYIFASKYAKGKLILFLDSDDFFDKNKIKNIVSYFDLNQNKQIVFDLPKLYFSKKKTKLLKLYKRIGIASIWPRFPPQSCVSIKSIFFRKISSKLLNKRFPNITLDFRIAVYSFFISKDFKILNDNLTYYFQDKFGESRRFSYLSKNWWFRRLEAHKYLKLFFKENKLNYFFGIDFLITYIVCYFVNSKRALKI